MNRVAVVILAAGSSSRLGSAKQLLDLGGRPVLAHTLAAVRRSSIEPVFVVLGHEAERIVAGLDLDATEICLNPDYRSGQSSSVRAAVRALPADVAAAIFVLGDQPLVEPAVIARLARSYSESPAPIIQPRYREGRGNPVLIARALFAELAELTGDAGARPLLARHADQVRLIDATAFPRPDDIDTLEDYQRLKQQFNSKQDRA